ncbi:MAG: HPP family protein [Plectolyngbya sp. WJT66-NPBG17]|jgi:CBS-domain-containing membrane protein|nr:HPP family protein [Plectolyngbya sp. WJT66-NPBG17]MBW4528156.1 HPP family protein [Phormidium tanganyikae FI6-MK23]
MRKFYRVRRYKVPLYHRFQSFFARSTSITQPHFSYYQIFCCWLGSFLSIAALAYLSVHTNYPLIAAPFGATAVILYTLPDSPLAQPHNVILGNCIGAIVCVTFVQCFGTAPWVIALSVATAIKLMQLTKTLHPPGGAVALVGAMTGASWSYLFVPVFAGSVVMVLCAAAFNHVGKTYPKR